MGLSRQSLYGAFGDKRGLFLEALERYSERSIGRMREAMDSQASAVAGLEVALLLDLGGGSDVESGCLGVGSVAEFGRSDPDISGHSDRAGIRATSAFSECVQRGIETGEFRSGIDPIAVGRMLLTLKSGLKVAARGGATEDDNRETVNLVLSGLLSV